MVVGNVLKTIPKMVLLVDSMAIGVVLTISGKGSLPFVRGLRLRSTMGNTPLISAVQGFENKGGRWPV